MYADALTTKLPPLSFKGQAIVLHPSGAAYLPGSGSLIVADLHFEKGSAYACEGQLLPPYDTSATLSALERVIGAFRPQRVISLGDAFHDREAEQRMAPEEAQRLEALCQQVEWHWVLGNHDPRAPMRFSGAAHQVMTLGDLVMVHEPGEAEGWSMAGHLHPCAVVAQSGCRVRRPCFVLDQERMIFPAFGAYTGGLNVLDEAFKPVLAPEPHVHVLGQEKVYQVPRSSLRPEAADWFSARKALR